MSDGTSLDIEINADSMLINARGSALSLADVGEQFAWFGASCQSSPFYDHIAYSCPSFTRIENGNLDPYWSCSYAMEQVKLGELEQNGSRWRPLFRNPTIAKGFPILARDNSEPGLELSLGLMAKLGGAERATVFGDQLLIKGFSTLFVPIKRIGTSVIWHFLFNESTRRTSYLAAKALKVRERIDCVNYTYLSLSSTRVFLGWASSVSLYTGTY